MNEYRLFIDGEWRAAADGRVAATINPATEEPWAHVAAAGPADVDAAVGAAKRSFADGRWRKLPRAERAAALSRIAAIILERAEELARFEVLDAGGTMRKANLADVPATAQTFQYYADLLSGSSDEEVFDEQVPVPSRNIVRREPIGVCACITPFNFPMAAASWKIAPAIAAGNSIVLKPSPHTPVTTLLLAEICHQAGVPAGVVNVLTGPGAALGEALVSHPDVDKIAFTGSTAVGKRIMELAAPRLTKLTLELGGKSPNIILEDANLDGAVRGALFGTFFHAGQVCESGTRVLVHASLHDELVERMVEGARSIKLGDPLDLATMMGPLVSDSQRANSERYVHAGREEGARVVTGGRRPPELARGYYYEPTIFAGVKNDMRIAREEIFGPVVSVLRFSDEEEALRLANDSLYGLGAAVWSRDVERAQRMAERIEAGTVWVNDYHLINVRFPFGGYKQSGFGRELGPWGLAEFQQVKHIHVGEPTGVDQKYYFGLLFD
ncbi:MAG TPA: aldehyde dehydrogenase family protein [Polyangia bacterium]|nr:aldehyde dehydrogenase family protein [Polyangia bacterium]